LLISQSNIKIFFVVLQWKIVKKLIKKKGEEKNICLCTQKWKNISLDVKLI
jgi:hypothetical protein